MNVWNTEKKRLIVVGIIGFLWRLFLVPLTIHADLITQAGWGKYIYEHGFLGLYDWSIWAVPEWPNHPPLISMWYGISYSVHSFLMSIFANLGVFIATHHLGAAHIPWYFQFLQWYGTDLYRLTGLNVGNMVTIKFLPILADLLLAGLVYWVAKQINPKKAFFAYALYMFIPFSWYISAAWGQSDQLGALFVFGSFILLSKNKLLLSPLLFALAFDFKPTVLLFLPYYFYLLFLQRKYYKQIIGGIVIAVIVVLLTIIPFTAQNPFIFPIYRLPRILFSKDTLVGVSAFNFWYIFSTPPSFSDKTVLLFLPYQVWGYVLYFCCFLSAIRFFGGTSLKNIFTSLFVTGLGAWMFLTNMYERYLFVGIAAGLIVSLSYPKLLKYWLLFNIFYWINLFNGFWFPEQFTFLKHTLEWNNGLLQRVFAAADTVLFILMVKQVGVFSKMSSAMHNFPSKKLKPLQFLKL